MKKLQEILGELDRSTADGKYVLATVEEIYL